MQCICPLFESEVQTGKNDYTSGSLLLGDDGTAKKEERIDRSSQGIFSSVQQDFKPGKYRDAAKESNTDKGFCVI